MKTSRITGWLVLSITGLMVLAARPVLGAGTNVSIVDFAFNPAAVTINPKDSVTWTWAGTFAHSTTSDDTNLWNSGILASGATFSHTFSSAGTFPYHCAVHPFMTASVTVQGQTTTNAPPTVTITAPVDGATFPAPWTGTIQASVADSDGTVARVEFLAGSTPLGTVSNPISTVSFTVTNLAAGNYALTAVATDNAGASTTSAPVNIKVVASGGIALSAAKTAAAGTFQFSYSASPGLNYAVDRSLDLSHWTALATNNAASSQVTFTDNAATGSANFYRVRLVSGQ